MIIKSYGLLICFTSRKYKGEHKKLIHSSRNTSTQTNEQTNEQTNRRINAFLGTTAVCFDVYGINVI